MTNGALLRSLGWRKAPRAVPASPIFYDHAELPGTIRLAPLQRWEHTIGAEVEGAGQGAKDLADHIRRVGEEYDLGKHGVPITPGEWRLFLVDAERESNRAVVHVKAVVLAQSLSSAIGLAGKRGLRVLEVQEIRDRVHEYHP